MDHRELGAAVIGLGVGRAHAAAYRRIDGARLVAVSSLDEPALKRAADAGLPVQFHTGAYSSADYLNAYRLRDNVRDLAELAIARPELRFVAMHAAYPFQDELVLAARQVSNLYAEMSWVWIVDPEAAAHFFSQMLVAAPLNKLIGFGGDYSLVENTLGHLLLARRGMARALAALVRDHGWTLADAIEAGGYALRHAALGVYGCG